MKRIIIFLASVFFGVISAHVWIVNRISVPFIPSSFWDTLYNRRDTVVLGFAPYWLRSKFNKDYTKYLTHYTYFGLTLNEDGTIQKLANPREEEPGWTTLKTRSTRDALENAAEKGLIISLLLHVSDEDVIASLLSDPETHGRNTVNEIMPVMKEFGFSDLNLDIESFQEASSGAREAFTMYVKTVHDGMQTNSVSLTVEYSPSVFTKTFLIEPERIGEIADHIVIMGYDYHYSGSFQTGPVAPLSYGNDSDENDLEKTLRLARLSVPTEKLILGLPFYGYEWETLSPRPGSPVIPGSSATASHRRIEEMLSSCPACTSSYDDKSQTPIAIIPSEDAASYRQIFYENNQSLSAKRELAGRYGLAGIAYWALGYEGNALFKPLEVE